MDYGFKHVKWNWSKYRLKGKYGTFQVLIIPTVYFNDLNLRLLVTCAYQPLLSTPYEQ